MRTDIFVDLFSRDTHQRARGRICTRCGGRHRDSSFKYCSVCRQLTGLWREAYRIDHKSRKLCPRCLAPKGRNNVECDYHRRYHNELVRRLYAEKRAAGLCTWGKCRNRTHDAVLCDAHARAA